MDMKWGMIAWLIPICDVSAYFHKFESKNIDPASLADFASSPLVAVLQRVLDEALPPPEVDALATKLEQGDLLHPARQDAKVGALLEQAKHALRAVRRGGTDEGTGFYGKRCHQAAAASSRH